MSLVVAFWFGLLVGMVAIYALTVPPAYKAVNALLAANERLEKRFREISEKFATPSACLDGDCCYDQPQEREV